MPRSPKSQWDFGELFPAAETRRVLSVSELTAKVKALVEGEFPQLWVNGEISNLRLQSSGHAYFVVKDARAQLNCVLFRGQAGVDRSLLRDGAQVVLGGELTVYEPRGAYQLRVTAVELQGVGALQAAFERLKQKLAAEGLFDAARKRPIPRFPVRIGLVTSPTGAAIRDVLHVIGRRFPRLEVILVPCCVQGDAAAGEIAAAVGLLNRWNAVDGAGKKGGRETGEREGSDSPRPAFIRAPLPPSGSRLDLILVTRGGGSLEDLWAFNEEVVARAIAASAIPMISAVGHEIDFTIADFVADLRAATPSAAAELITQNYVNSREFVAGAMDRLRELARRHVAWSTDEWRDTVKRLSRMHPRRQVERHAQHLDDLITLLLRAVGRGAREQAVRWRTLGQRLLAARPSALLLERRQTLREWTRRLGESARARLREHQTGLAARETRLRLLSPLNVLERGYSITLDAGSGVVVHDASRVKAGQRLRTRLKSGEITSVAEGQG